MPFGDFPFSNHITQLAAKEAYLAAKAEIADEDRRRILAEFRVLIQEAATTAAEAATENIVSRTAAAAAQAAAEYAAASAASSSPSDGSDAKGGGAPPVNGAKEATALAGVVNGSPGAPAGYDADANGVSGTAAAEVEVER